MLFAFGKCPNCGADISEKDISIIRGSDLNNRGEAKSLLEYYKQNKNADFDKYKQAFDILQNSTSCNECEGRFLDCGLVKWGEKVVYNCPFFVPFMDDKRDEV